MLFDTSCNIWAMNRHAVFLSLSYSWHPMNMAPDLGPVAAKRSLHYQLNEGRHWRGIWMVEPGKIVFVL